ncbi:hypothetical protein A2160_02605 [Candidatus Beckwithbacteria bacterium RBG_13_42_9]|uniref:BioF2-like acetyltransferase domain-containing protein n=1 Tax=Candidatus Beckwithbacteria bacterium RBG_13_42_9 TaxID=1797457 RepID=A0A1F5E7H5_9BACT|nr:MAG: hypothetical protein A2160_02605 [Candidatus Beckwithbacteria bacterium RBG_13_42_9]
MLIENWTKKEWDIFVKTSPQGDIFCQSCFLGSYNQPIKYLRCSRGEETLAGFAFIESAKQIRSMPFQGYSGIIFKDFSNLTPYHRNLIVFSVLSAFAEYLFSHYDQVIFNNHWEIIDMRPFDWLNYHQREKGYFKISVRYTSHLDISNPDDTSGYARLRTRDLKREEKGVKFSTKESDDIELLSYLHGQNFKRQGIKRKKTEIYFLKRICENLIQAKSGKLFVTYVNQKPAVSSFFIFDRFRAYHLFVGADLHFRYLGVGTKNFFDCCQFLNKILGLKEVDMGGINSPLRGSYKLSYGGKIVPYYNIEKVSAE